MQRFFAALVLLAALSCSHAFTPSHLLRPASPLPLAASPGPGRAAISPPPPGPGSRVRGGAAPLHMGFLDGLFGGGAEVPAEAPPPPAPAEDWQEAIDPSSGNPYYYNAVTGETSWERPVPIAAGVVPPPPQRAVTTPEEAAAFGGGRAQPGGLGVRVEEEGGGEALDIMGVQKAIDRVAQTMPTTADGEVAMPLLYDGWFSAPREFMGAGGETVRRLEGRGQMASQMVDAINAAQADGLTRMEVTVPPVPNLEEVDFGTAINQQFGLEIRDDLGLTDIKFATQVRRNLVDYANHYWALKVAGGCGGDRGVLVAHCDQTSKKDIPLRGGVQWVGSPGRLPKTPDGGDFVIVVNPGPQDQWEECDKRTRGAGVSVFLNSISGGWTYELGGPLKDYEQVYYLKRVSKGWVFRAYPGKWQALVEAPDGTTVPLKTYDERPLLRDVSKLVRDFSFTNYGLMNDRYAKGFGGRL